MTDKQKLKLMKLCEHWADHNDSHVESFKKWHKIAKEMQLNEVADDLMNAIEAMNKSTEFLISAKQKLE
jgi:nickel/cobalt transporter (NicO) family protein